MDEEAPALSETGARIRPLGIVVVVLLSIGRIILELAHLFADRIGPIGLPGGSPIPDFPPNTPEWYLGQAAILALIVLTAVSVVGLWQIKNWGWALSLILAGVVLLFDLGWWWSGQPRYVGMFMNMIAVLYLNQRDVRTIFLPPSSP